MLGALAERHVAGWTGARYFAREREVRDAGAAVHLDRGGDLVRHGPQSVLNRKARDLQRLSAAHRRRLARVGALNRVVAAYLQPRGQ